MNSSRQPNRRSLFFTLCLAYIATGMGAILPGPALSVLAEHTHVSLDVAGWAFTTFSLGFTTGAMAGGLLSTHLSAKHMLLIALVTMGLLTSIAPLTHSFVLLLVAQFAVGISYGLVDVSINMLVTRAFRDQLGETLNNLHSAFGIGALIGPLLLALSLQFFHEVTWAFLAGSLTAIAAFFLLLRQPDAITMVRPEESLETQNVPRGRVLAQTVLWLMALQMFLYVGAEVGFSNWITTAISQSAAVSLVIAAPSTTIYWLGLTIGRLVGAQLIRRTMFGERRLLYLCFFGGALAGLVVALFPGQLSISFSFTLLVGLFYGPIFPGIMAIASRRFMHALGTISSVMLLGAGASGLTLPVLVGIGITHLGVSWGMALPTVTCLLIAIPFYLAERKRPLLTGDANATISAQADEHAFPPHQLPSH